MKQKIAFEGRIFSICVKHPRERKNMTSLSHGINIMSWSDYFASVEAVDNYQMLYWMRDPDFLSDNQRWMSEMIYTKKRIS